MSELEELLVLESSRRNTDMIAGIIIQRPELFKNLIDIILKNEHPVSWKAAWVADTVTEQNPGLLEHHLKPLIFNLGIFKADGTKRSVLRMLSRQDIPANLTGPLISICFDLLNSGREPIAIKMFAMENLYRISEKEPGIRNELADSIAIRIEEGPPGVLSAGRKILKKIARLERSSK